MKTPNEKYKLKRFQPFFFASFYFSHNVLRETLSATRCLKFFPRSVDVKEKSDLKTENTRCTVAAEC